MTHSPSSNRKPNVLLICADHWAGGFLGSDGHPVVMTPTVDQLARYGTRFANAYAPCPTCIPARRSLMLGQSSRTHGDRTFNETCRMPEATPTLAQCFRDAGYQAHCVGKLHVYPQRNRIGFDDVLLNEEGRHHLGGHSDDWELYLQEQGHAGEEYASGLCNNDFVTRTWHLPEKCHPTNWAARTMCQTMHRRDPDKPAFWYLSFVGPHQPVWPLQTYVDLYRHQTMDEPVMGDWSAEFDAMPWMCRRRNATFAVTQQHATPGAVDIARRHFYATITHIDHQIRAVIGYLREQGELENTIIAFTSDHGEMLGDHAMWTKAYMYDRSARIPLIISPPAADKRLQHGAVDNRLVEIRDIMPTLLDLAGIDIPASVDGQSLLKPESRSHIYGEHYEGPMSTRMVRDAQYKLIYYAAGNVRQLFDMQADPRETRDLSRSATHAATLDRLTQTLIGELYGSDTQWLNNGQLVGLPVPADAKAIDRGLAGQRGYRFI